jgi:hypothetical protein
MKTTAEVKFEKIIEEGFQEQLKPLGFKKKGNNFYLQLEHIGQIISVQKSAWHNKNAIRFTIDTGIFVPEYWAGFFNFHESEMPDYPKYADCLIRLRIGQIKKQRDTWYDINDGTDEEELIAEMKNNVANFILPFFETVNSMEKVLDFLEREQLILAPLGKMITYAEFKLFEKAKQEYQRLLTGGAQQGFLETVRKYAEKYGFLNEV